MIDNLMYMMQTTTVEQLKTVIDKNTFADKNLKDFNKGTEMLDKAAQLNNNSANRVWLALIAYAIYKLKGGK